MYGSTVYGWDLAKWLERLTAKAETTTVPGFDPSILRHSEIWGAVDEAVLNTVHRKKISKYMALKQESGGMSGCICESVQLMNLHKPAFI